MCMAWQDKDEHRDVHAETALMEKQTVAEKELQLQPISHVFPSSKHRQMLVQGHEVILPLNFK